MKCIHCGSLYHSRGCNFEERETGSSYYKSRMRCRAWLPVTFQLYKHFRSFFSSQMDDLYFFSLYFPFANFYLHFFASLAIKEEIFLLLFKNSKINSTFFSSFSLKYFFSLDQLLGMITQVKKITVKNLFLHGIFKIFFIPWRTLLSLLLKKFLIFACWLWDQIQIWSQLEGETSR